MTTRPKIRMEQLRFLYKILHDKPAQTIGMVSRGLMALTMLYVASCAPPHRFQKRYPNPEGTVSLVMDVEKERGDLGTQQVEVYLEQGANRQYVGRFDHFTPVEPHWKGARAVNVCELSAYPDFKRRVTLPEAQIEVSAVCLVR